MATRVTPAVATNIYSFSANSVAAQNSGNGAFVKVNFATELWDYNSNYDASTSTYTAPFAGIYCFNASVATQTTGRFIISLYKGGSEYKRGTDLSSASNRVTSFLSCQVALAAGDTVDIRSFGDSSKALATVGTEIWFDGYLRVRTF